MATTPSHPDPATSDSNVVHLISNPIFLSTSWVFLRIATTINSSENTVIIRQATQRRLILRSRTSTPASHPPKYYVVISVNNSLMATFSRRSSQCRYSNALIPTHHTELTASSVDPHPGKKKKETGGSADSPRLTFLLLQARPGLHHTHLPTRLS